MCTWDFSTLFVGNTRSSWTHAGLGIVPPAPFKWFFSGLQVVSLYTRRPWRFPQLLLCEDLLSLVLCPVDSSWFGLSKIPTLSPQLREIECFQSSPFCAMVWKLIQYVLILSWALWVGDILWEVIGIYSQCRPGSKIPQEGVTEGKEKILS